MPMMRKSGLLLPLTCWAPRQSHPVGFAPCSFNERTLEKWEQGRSKPNPEAAALVLLVRIFSVHVCRKFLAGHKRQRGADVGPTFMYFLCEPLPVPVIQLTR